MIGKKRLSDYISDPDLKRIAQTHDLDDWGWENSARDLAMMEGAALAIQSIYDEGRDVEIYVHQSGAMEIWGGAYFHYQVNEVAIAKEDRDAMDWDDDPVVKKYEGKGQLTLKWDEAQKLFGEDDR